MAGKDYFADVQFVLGAVRVDASLVHALSRSRVTLLGFPVSDAERLESELRGNLTNIKDIRATVTPLFHFRAPATQSESEMLRIYRVELVMQA